MRGGTESPLLPTFQKIGPVDAVRLQRVGRLGMGGIVACVVGYLGKARQRPLAVDRLSRALKALQPGFLDQHDYQRS
jgi:hypothetical protein